MGQSLIKAKNHFCAAVKKAFYKIAFGKNLKFGSNVTFRKYFTLCIEGNAKVEIGDRCFFNNGCSLNVLDGLTIGNDCIFGENVKLYDHNHKFRDVSKPVKDQGYSTGKIVIGSNCWIGSNVTVLKGVKIGSRCVVGAGCLIYKDIPDNTIVKNKNELIYEQF